MAGERYDRGVYWRISASGDGQGYGIGTRPRYSAPVLAELYLQEVAQTTQLTRFPSSIPKALKGNIAEHVTGALRVLTDMRIASAGGPTRIRRTSAQLSHVTSWCRKMVFLIWEI